VWIINSQKAHLITMGWNCCHGNHWHVKKANSVGLILVIQFSAPRCEACWNFKSIWWMLMILCDFFRNTTSCSFRNLNWCYTEPLINNTERNISWESKGMFHRMSTKSKSTYSVQDGHFWCCWQVVHLDESASSEEEDTNLTAENAELRNRDQVRMEGESFRNALSTNQSSFLSLFSKVVRVGLNSLTTWTCLSKHWFHSPITMPLVIKMSLAIC